MSKPPEPKQTRFDLFSSRIGNTIAIGQFIGTCALAAWTFFAESWLPVAVALVIASLLLAPLVPLAARQYQNLYLSRRGHSKVALDPTTEQKLRASIDQAKQEIDERVEYQYERIVELTSSSRSIREELFDLESVLNPSDHNDVGQQALPDRLRRIEIVQNDYKWMVPTIQKLWDRSLALGFVGYIERIAILKQTGLEIERALSRDRPPADLEQQVDAWLRGSEMASRIVRPYDDFMAGKLITSPSSGEIVEQLPRFNNVEFPAAISGAADATSHWHAVSGSYAYKLRLFWIRWALLGQFHADLSTPFYREIDRSAG